MMLTKHPAPRTLLLSASTVFTLLLSACGTTPLPAQQGRSGIDVDKLLAAADKELVPDTTVLVKGSRFMKMERVADALAAEETR